MQLSLSPPPPPILPLRRRLLILLNLPSHPELFVAGPASPFIPHSSETPYDRYHRAKRDHRA